MRPGVGITWTVAPRVAIIGFAGYSFNRPDLFYRSADGTEYRNEWKADAILLSVGAVTRFSRATDYTDNTDSFVSD